MEQRMRVMRCLWLVGAIVLGIASGCGDDSGNGPKDAAVAQTFTVGGTVTGLSGSVTLQLNGGDAVTLAQDGAFVFATELAGGEPYVVTVSAQPAMQTCTVNQATGTIGGAVTDIEVICSASSYAVGGTISGLSGFVVLQNNGTDDLTVAANGTFTFGTKVADGADYSVTILTQPTGQICNVTSAMGTITGGPSSSVVVTCTTLTYSLGGNVSGLSGTLVLSNNGGDDKTITATGAFTFATELPFGAGYLVTVKTQPGGQTCSVTNGTGTMGTVAVNNIEVVCSANTFTIGGSISGLSGTVVLQNNGANDLTVTNLTSFTFTTPVAQGGGYAVTVKTHPDSQQCTVSAASGTNVQANVTTVQVTCIAYDIADVSTTSEGLVGGQMHTLAVINGELWAWGGNSSGQLGNAMTSTLRLPTKIGAVSTWSKVSAGSYFSMALRQNGTMWTWGNNQFGQLGDGSTVGQSEPRQIGGATQWDAISAGLYVGYAIRMDDTLWGWGNDAYRQLGDGNGSTTSPVQVDAATNWTVIDQSAVSTEGRRSDGRIWGRGVNGQGQLGDNSMTTQTTWVQAGTSTSWVTVSIGGSLDSMMNNKSHTLAIRSDGLLFAWGDNSAGQYGNGTTTSSAVPVQIGADTWLAVSAGDRYSLGIKTNGTLWAWGDNSYRQLGDGTTTSRPSPVQIGSATNWQLVRAGIVRSFGVRSNDTLWGWGYNGDGGLGDNTFTNRSSPVRLLP